MSNDVEDTKTDAEGKPKRKPLTLRRTEKGSVKQSFSHGRSKTVVVETKKRRTLTPTKKVAADKDTEASPKVEKKTSTKKTVAPKSDTVEVTQKESTKKGAVLRTLSDDEKQARAEVLVKARKEAEVRKVREKAEEAERQAREAEEASRLAEDKKRIEAEESKRAKEAEVRRKAEEEARIALEAEEAERERKKRDSQKAPRESSKETIAEADQDNRLPSLVAV